MKQAMTREHDLHQMARHLNFGGRGRSGGGVYLAAEGPVEEAEFDANHAVPDITRTESAAISRFIGADGATNAQSTFATTEADRDAVEEGEVDIYNVQFLDGGFDSEDDELSLELEWRRRLRCFFDRFWPFLAARFLQSRSSRRRQVIISRSVLARRNCWSSH